MSVNLGATSAQRMDQALKVQSRDVTVNMHCLISLKILAERNLPLFTFSGVANLIQLTLERTRSFRPRRNPSFFALVLSR